MLAVGCLIVVLGGVILAAVAAVLGAVAALFLTPIPYVVLALVGVIFLALRIREQRIRKVWFDAVAALQGLDGAPIGAVERLWQAKTEEPDVLLLRAVHAAHAGRNDDALGLLYAAGMRSNRIGSLSGGAAYWLPGLLEPLWLGGAPATGVNYQLAFGQMQSLAGRAAEAVQTLASRLHEPHFAAALGALADAYWRSGARDRAAAVLQQYVQAVGDPVAQRQLRYRLAVLLDESGAQASAAAELRSVLAEGEFGDAGDRLARIENQAANSRRMAVAAMDEAAFADGVARIRAASGPRGREKALESGLARLQQAHMRERLLLAASRAEVESVLEKVAGLKTRKAKERNLMEALDKLLSDEVPDELQNQEIALLQRALGELEADR